MRRSQWKTRVMVAALLALLLGAPGCTTLSPGTKSVIDRIFPKDPDDVFVGDSAREIDKRLSSSTPNVNF